MTLKDWRIRAVRYSWAAAFCGIAKSERSTCYANLGSLLGTAEGSVRVVFSVRLGPSVQIINLSLTMWFLVVCDEEIGVGNVSVILPRQNGRKSRSGLGDQMSVEKFI